MYKRFIHLFVLSCDKAAFLIEKQLQSKLSFIERLQLRLHLSLCHSCLDYRKDAIIIDKTIKQLVSLENKKTKTTFSNEELTAAKKRFSEQIKKYNKDQQN